MSWLSTGQPSDGPRDLFDWSNSFERVVERVNIDFNEGCVHDHTGTVRPPTGTTRIDRVREHLASSTAQSSNVIDASVTGVNVEIFCDVGCLWCYIGERRFEAAVAQFGQEVTVMWRPFMPDPTGSSAPTPVVDTDAQAACGT